MPMHVSMTARHGPRTSTRLFLSPSRPWSVSTLVAGRVGCSVGHPVPAPLVMDSLLRMLHPPRHQLATSPPI